MLRAVGHFNLAPAGRHDAQHASTQPPCTDHRAGGLPSASLPVRQRPCRCCNLIDTQTANGRKQPLRTARYTNSWIRQ